MSPKPTFELLLGYFIFSGISGLEARAARHNGEKLTVKKWWILGADFFTVWCRFFHGLRRFFTVCKGHKRWKQNISLLMIFFTVSFSRFTPSRKVGVLLVHVLNQRHSRALQGLFCSGLLMMIAAPCPFRDVELHSFVTGLFWPTSSSVEVLAFKLPKT